MAGIVILVATVNRTNAPTGQYRLSGQGVVEGAPAGDEVSWEVFVNYSDSTAVVNAACKDAAVAAAVTAGFTVGPADSKTLFAGAVIA